MDLAAGGPHVAVSGGEHRVHFSLQARADGAWDVTISTHKAGFESFIVCSPREVAVTEAKSCPCSPRSSIFKLCTIRFTVQIGSGEVSASVRRLHTEVAVVDRFGRSLLGEAMCASSCFAGVLSSTAHCAGSVALRLCSRWR
uniref:Uncharacterized protein n=1 Tax=Alexandrium andersonii TaxID=327968 RepID=A0A7S2CQJ1_9DINO